MLLDPELKREIILALQDRVPGIQVVFADEGDALVIFGELARGKKQFRNGFEITPGDDEATVIRRTKELARVFNVALSFQVICGACGADYQVEHKDRGGQFDIHIMPIDSDDVRLECTKCGNHVTIQM